MGKGKIVYNGSTSYTFERNYTKEYGKHKFSKNIVTETVDGRIDIVNRFTRMHFILPFVEAPTNQVETFEDAVASGLVDFYPDGDISLTKYRGSLEFEAEPKAAGVPNAWNFTVFFKETK